MQPMLHHINCQNSFTNSFTAKPVPHMLSSVLTDVMQMLPSAVNTHTKSSMYQYMFVEKLYITLAYKMFCDTPCVFPCDKHDEVHYDETNSKNFHQIILCIRLIMQSALTMCKSSGRAWEICQRLPVLQYHQHVVQRVEHSVLGSNLEILIILMVESSRLLMLRRDFKHLSTPPTA